MLHPTRRHTMGGKHAKPGEDEDTIWRRQNCAQKVYDGKMPPKGIPLDDATKEPKIIMTEDPVKELGRARKALEELQVTAKQ